MATRRIRFEMVCFDKKVKGVDPKAVHSVRLPGGAVMPVAAFGTFHSDWAQAYMKDATVEAIRLGALDRLAEIILCAQSHPAAHL